MENILNVSDKKLISLYGKNVKREDFENRVSNLASIFARKFSANFTDAFSSPGRIEICGNHTDHNFGKVIVGAINCDTLALTKKQIDKITVHSIGFGDMEVDLHDLEYKESEKGTSVSIIKGVAQGFVKRGLSIGGFCAVVDSTVFKGAGVSSSASFELLICQILNHYYNEGNIDEITLAKIGQESEVEYFGKPCGLLDQSGISLGGICAIDFENPDNPKIERLGYSLADLEIILVATGSHENLTGEYVKIRKEMALISSHFGEKVLRKVSWQQFVQALPELKAKYPERAVLRAIHFFEENNRVDLLKTYIKNSDVKNIIKTINSSGNSSATMLQNLYVEGQTSQGIPLAINIAKALFPDVAARVHGGGFAGTAIIFAKQETSQNLQNELIRIFGKENVSLASVRKLGACTI